MTEEQIVLNDSNQLPSHIKVRYLFICLGTVGDILLTTPLLRCLSAQVEGAEIHYLTNINCVEILHNNPYVKKVYTTEIKLLDTIEKLKNKLFDYIIDLQNDNLSKQIARHLQLITFTYKKSAFKNWLLINLKINKLPKTHIVDQYFDTLNVFDVVNDNSGVDYYIPDTDKVRLTSLPAGISSGYIAFVIGARFTTRRLTPEKINSIVSNISTPVILIGDTHDENLGNEIEKKYSHVYNACGKYNLNQTASLISQSFLVITHQTSLMQVAAAFRKKIIVIFGNTIPDFGIYPYLTRKYMTFMEVDGLKCRPCSSKGFKTCPKNHFKCIKQLDEQQIIETIKHWTENQTQIEIQNKPESNGNQ